MAETQQTDTTTVHTTETRTEGEKSTLLSDILSIIGFAILFIIIIWGILHLASLSSSWFSSLFYKPAPTIEVSAPASATSGTPVTVSWKYSPSVSGSYAFLYECKDGLQFATKNPIQGATSTYLGVPCGVAYSAPSTNNSMTLLPLLPSTTTTSVLDTMTIVFIPSGTGSQVQGSASMTIDPAQVVVATTTPAKPVVKTPAPTYVAPQYSSPADLSVRIISASVDQTGAGTVSFDIANVGGSPSGNYSFTATLPIQSSYAQSYGGTMEGNVFVSPEQASLAPGSHIVNTLRFSETTAGGGTFSVAVNANDADYGNNSASTQISAPYYQQGYNTNYNPTPYTVYPTTYPTYTY